MTIGDRFDKMWAFNWENLWPEEENAMPLTEVTIDNVEAVFTYQPWNEEQTKRGQAVRDALVAAAKVIFENVPRCPARTRVINSLIDARMIANAAISLEHLH